MKLLTKSSAPDARLGIVERSAYMAPQKILCKRFSTKARVSHVSCA